MIVLVVVASLLGALLNATAAIMQRRVAGVRHQKELFSHRMFLSIARKKKFLISVSMQITAFILQAFALAYSAIILVEPLMTMMLVFMILILHFRYKIPAGLKEWSGITLSTVGLIAMLVTARPRGEHMNFNQLSWLLVVAFIVIIIAGCIFIMRRMESANMRALFGGIAGAVNIGLSAAFIKLVVTQIHLGFIPLFTTWELYALALSGLSTVIILQSVFASGPLVISQPIIEILNPIVSGIIAVTLFGSTIDSSPKALAIAIPGLIVAIIGLALIGSSKRYQKAHLA